MWRKRRPARGRAARWSAYAPWCLITGIFALAFVLQRKLRRKLKAAKEKLGNEKPKLNIIHAPAVPQISMSPTVGRRSSVAFALPAPQTSSEGLSCRTLSQYLRSLEVIARVRIRL